MRTLILCSVALLLTLTAFGAPAKAPLRALIVTGGHGFEREPFFAIFDSFGGIEWREVVHPGANDSYAPDQRGTYDVIVLYDMVQDISDAQKANLIATLKQGKGLVVLHHALASYQAWPEYAQIIGGRFFLQPTQWEEKEWPTSTATHGLDLTIEIADSKHPITKGLDDFQIHDETYGGFWVNPKAHPLLKVEHPTSGEVIGWTTQYGKSRVVYLELGHDHFAYDNPGYRTLIERSILWTAKRLKR